MQLVKAEELSKRYVSGKRGRERETWALREVSFELESGTVLGVIGANGAGKTTLLKVLARVTPPTSGRATVHGRVVSLLELGAGFQSDLSGRENILLNAAMYGVPRSEIAGRLDEIVDFAGLEQSIDIPVKRYSSGMYLRLAFAAAVNMEPDILLADEVLAVGDLEFQERCLARVEEDAGQNGLGVLFVSHDMDAIARLCHRVLWINAGEIVQIGDPQEVITAYERSAWALIDEKGGKGKGKGNELGRVDSIRLLGATGSEVGAVRVDEDLVVEISFETRMPGMRVRPALGVETGGTTAFWTLSPERWDAPEPGLYRARGTIPAHLLADTVYSLGVALVLEHGEETKLAARRKAATFRVYDTDEASSARGGSRRQLRGVVRPRLDWELEPAAAEADAVGR